MKTDYTMPLSNERAEAGYFPKKEDASASVTFEVTDGGPAITGIKLTAKAEFPGI